MAERGYQQLTGAATRIGFDFPKRRHPVWRYCHTALASTQQHNQLHTVQQNLSILAPLGLPLNDAPARMGYSEADWATSRALLPEEFRKTTSSSSRRRAGSLNAGAKIGWAP